MQDAFKHDKDVYATIASVAFKVPYEQCLEFHPETHEYQPDGKKRRNEAKTILLGVTYGRSVPSIADQLYGKRDDMSQYEKIKAAQKVYDAVMNNFPGLRAAMLGAQDQARKFGYTETILGRRRHIPDMQLSEFEFKPMPGYVNPDIDPLDPSTLNQKEEIPKRITDALLNEFKGYKYFGQIVKRTKQLAEEHIRVINNRAKINDASRMCLNSIIQGSAAEQTKMAILELENDPDWKRVGGRLLTPVHDELVAEVPMENWKEGGEILSRCMVDAASFLPFPSKCDVEYSLRWYGLEYPCPYKQPESLDTVDPDEIKWIQYMLFECEYSLPKHKEVFGEEFRGDIAKGVDGVYSDEIKSILNAYGKSPTLVKVDEISSPGSIRLRIRSMIESMRMKGDFTVSDKPNRTIIKRYEKNDRRAILVPKFGQFYDPMILTLLERSGYDTIALPEPDVESVELGLRYANQDICYPATIVIGDIIRAVQSGKYDPKNIAAGITQTGGQCPVVRAECPR